MAAKVALSCARTDVSSWALDQNSKPGSRRGSNRCLATSKSSVSIGGLARHIEECDEPEEEVPKSDRGVDVVNSDMTPEVQEYAMRMMKKCVKHTRIFREIAELCKKEMDRKYGTVWQCVVGREYGMRVTHETGCFLFATVDGFGILLYRSE